MERKPSKSKAKTQITADDPAFAALTAATARITAAAIEAKVITKPSEIFQFMLDTYSTAANF